MAANETNGTGNHAPRPFPALPIITLDQPPPAPKLTQQQKYGGLFWLGIVGLFVVVALVGWFGWNLYAMRDVWTNVYALHETSKPESERIQAAFSLSRDVRVNAQQRWDIALRKPLPPLARYLIAESWTTDIPRSDTVTFAKTITYSEGWPEWLKLLGVRLMAVSAGEGQEFPVDVLNDLVKDKNPNIGLFVDYVRAVSQTPDPQAAERIRLAGKSDSPSAGLAQFLEKALDPNSIERSERLNQATEWLWSHDPEAMKITQGWRVIDGKLTQTQP